MCARACVVLDMLGQSDAWIADKLAYANQSTISSVRRGEAFFDTERLVKLGRLPLARDAYPNLHWLLTGVGRPVVASEGANASDVDALSTYALLKAEPATKLTR